MPILLQLLQQKCVPFQGEIHWEMNFHSNLFAFSSRENAHLQFYWREEEPPFASPTVKRNALNKRPQRETGGIIKTHIQTSYTSKIQNKIHVAAPAATGSAATWRDEHLSGMWAANPFVEEWSPLACRRDMNVLWLAEPGPVRSWADFARCYLKALRGNHEALRQHHADLGPECNTKSICSPLSDLGACFGLVLFPQTFVVKLIKLLKITVSYFPETPHKY